MKLTKTKLKRIIKEELENVINEQANPMDCAYSLLSQAADVISKKCPGVFANVQQKGGGPNKDPDAYILTVKPK